MRYDGLRLTSPYASPTVIDLPLVGLSQSSNFILKSVTGLEPPDIDVGVKTTLDNAGIFQNVRPQNREIVMLIRLNPTWSLGQTVSDLRAQLYNMISIDGNPTTIEIRYAGATILQTTGWVKKFEASIFAPDSEVQITFGCYIPFLVPPGVTNVSFTGLSKTAPVITNPGSAPSGFLMEITLTGAQAGGFTLTDDRGNKLQITYAFLSGDKITINTIAGSMAVSVLRSGTTTNLVQYISSDSKWLQMHAGVNTFTTSFSTFNWTTLLYIPFYWGI